MLRFHQFHDFKKFIDMLAVFAGMWVIVTILSNSTFHFWFSALHKPVFIAPSWVFHAAAFCACLIVAIVFFRLRLRLPHCSVRWREQATVYLSLCVALMIMWPVVFLLLHGILFALLIAMVMFVLSLTLSIALWGVDRISSYLLIVFTAGVCYGTFVNAALLAIN